MHDMNNNIQETDARLRGPMPKVNGLTALVYGAGKSGSAAIRLLLREGAQVRVFDHDSAKIDQLKKEWGTTGITLVRGELQPMDDLDFCIVSPGVPIQGKWFDWLRESNTPLIGELEFASRYLQRPIIAVGGTNGKTTVVSMVHHILQQHGLSSSLAGNVGYPLSQLILEESTTGSDPVVVEVSSYQCETIDEFHPVVSVITNLAPDHLDRYGSIEEYYETKFFMAANQAPNEVLIMGPGVEGDCPEWVIAKQRVIDLNDIGSEGLFVDGDALVLHDGSKKERFPCASFLRKPTQQILNAMAAMAATHAYGVPLAEALQAIESFEALPHRLEPVAEFNGITFINDSKATNVHALGAALVSLPAPIRLILGGRAKGDSLDPVKKLISDKISGVHLIGEAAMEFYEQLSGLVDLHVDRTVEHAVKHAYTIACENIESEKYPQETILLSPACASWDQFKDYVERGDRFKEVVKELRS